MEKWVKRTIEFAAGLFIADKLDPSVIPYIPSKLKISGEEKKYFPRSRPEDCGVSSGRLLAFLCALENEKSAIVHNLMCVKNGKVILECSHPGYNVNTWHLSHSMSKVLVSIAVGFLVSDGLLSLDEHLVDLLPEYKYKDKRFQDITVRHLLTMTAGVRFGEAGVVSENEWTSAFFNSSMIHSPGARFTYNSMNTYILGRIAVKLTGRSLTDFLGERLLAPLGITNFYWELGPEGVEKGGFGVFMSAESWAKIGTLFLNGGRFEGKEIISPEWIADSVKPHVAVPDNLGNFDYGYKVWVSKTTSCYLFSGMLGQAVCVFPNNGTVIVMNSGNNELFQSGRALAIIEHFFGEDLSNDVSCSTYHGSELDLKRCAEHFFEKRHWIRPMDRGTGLASRLGLAFRVPYPEAWDKLIGSFDFPANNQGLLPIFIRAMQNNLGNSIDRISFVRENNRIFFICKDGKSTYKLEVGFCDFATTVLEVSGEKYIVKVIGEATEDLERNEAFKLEILLPEMPNTRKILFTFTDIDRLNMRIYETPDNGLLRPFSNEILKTNNRFAPLVDHLEHRLGESYLKRKFDETFDITLLGARIGSPDHDRILEESREARHKDERSVRLIDAIINRFISENDEDNEKGESKDTIDSAITARHDDTAEDE